MPCCCSTGEVSESIKFNRLHAINCTDLVRLTSKSVIHNNNPLSNSKCIRIEVFIVLRIKCPSERISRPENVERELVMDEVIDGQGRTEPCRKNVWPPDRQTPPLRVNLWPNVGLTGYKFRSSSAAAGRVDW